MEDVPLDVKLTLEMCSTFGNTLSYVDSTGSTGAAGPQVLADTTIHSAKEITIMTDQACDSSCGYVQPGSVAYSK
jgi:hypothetical protein